jgi:regulator of protease activity HflC (stomatin/prohibitin superfamily)
MPFLIILAVALIIIILANIKIVPQAQEYVIEFLGKYKTTWGAGIHVKVPFGCHATLYLPKKYLNVLKENETPVSAIGAVVESDKEFGVELISGEYTFMA